MSQKKKLLLNFTMLREIIVEERADGALYALVACSTNSAGRWIWK
jgi:hypothetical protein